MVGAMGDNSEDDDQDGSTCVGCRGRGWKFVSSRAALVARVSDDGSEPLPEEACLRCGGRGLEAAERVVSHGRGTAVS